MQNVNIMNPQVQSILEEFQYFFLNQPIALTNNQLNGDNPDYWTGDEFLESIMEDHDGSPKNACSYCLKPDHYNGLDSQYKIVYNDINDRLSLELGVSHSALSQMYPPDGFIAWHTNENAVGHNLIFTWSETGDGYFEYLDKEGKKVRMQDKVGWSCKAGYFGAREENEHVYHCARTNCKRITLSYVMADTSDRMRPLTDWWEDCVEHIQRG